MIRGDGRAPTLFAWFCLAGVVLNALGVLALAHYLALARHRDQAVICAVARQFPHAFTGPTLRPVVIADCGLGVFREIHPTQPPPAPRSQSPHNAAVSPSRAPAVVVITPQAPAGSHPSRTTRPASKNQARPGPQRSHPPGHRRSRPPAGHSTPPSPSPICRPLQLICHLRAHT